MLLVLDRDGVINFESVEYIKSPDEWIPIPGSIEAIGQLSKTHHKIVIATNQSGVGRQLFSLQTLERIHQKMLNQIEQVGGKIERIYFCPHHPDENCLCRKPKPGLLQQIQRDFQIKSDEMISIGDSMRDFEAAQAVGCEFILVRTGNGNKTEKKLAGSPIKIFDDLLSFAKYQLDPLCNLE